MTIVASALSRPPYLFEQLKNKAAVALLYWITWAAVGGMIPRRFSPVVYQSWNFQFLVPGDSMALLEVVKKGNTGTVTLIRFTGTDVTLDETYGQELLDAVAGTDAPPKVVVSFYSANAMRTAFLHYLLSAQQSCEQNGGSFAVFGMHGSVKVKYESMNFQQVFDTFDYPSDAIRFVEAH